MSGEAAAAPPAATDPLAALGFITAAEVADSAWARCLILGPGKTGKTTAIATTCGGPLAILNADGDSATKYARKCGADFHQFDVANRITLQRGVSAAIKAAKAGHVRFILLDSLSLLADRLLDELTITISDSRQRYGELGSVLQGVLKTLFDAPAHVLINCHMSPASEDEGILPLIAGATKHKAINLANDVVIFDYIAGRQPHERMFLCGPQKSWNYSGRNMRRSNAVEATVPALFEELGIAL